MNYYYRFHFSIFLKGVRIKLNINGNNIYSAYSKARRMYPQADKIQVTQTERIK